jgi:hypothetical protein
VFDIPNQEPVVVITQLPWSEAPPITSMTEILIAEIGLKYVAPEAKDSWLLPRFMVVEHYYHCPSGIPGEVFDVVSFQNTFARPLSPRQSWRDRVHKMFHPNDDFDRPVMRISRDWRGRLTLSEPSWKSSSRSEIEEMIGQEYADSFRPVLRVWQTDPALTHVVGLLREKLYPFTQFNGPLCAINIDERFVEPAYGYGRLYLMMDNETPAPCWSTPVDFLSPEFDCYRGTVRKFDRSCFLRQDTMDIYCHRFPSFIMRVGRYKI